MKNKWEKKRGGEERGKAEAWFNFLENLQEKPAEVWSEDVFKVFNLINRYKHERIYHRIIRGIPVIVIIHSTKRGKASGGTRIFGSYKNMENFLIDGLKLSAAMTFKSIWARLPLGGGKAVIWAFPQEITEDFLKEYAEFLNEINAEAPFFTGEDVGFSEHFADVTARYSPYIVGKSLAAGGLGDPSPRTTKGLHIALRTIVEKGGIFRGTLRGKIATMQGAGKVALPWIEMLAGEGVTVYFSENDGEAAAEERARMAESLGARRVSKDEIYSVACHFFLPCATGGVINKNTRGQLSQMCRVIMGAANNILDTPEEGIELHKEKRIYLPDYVVNRYGLEWVSQENKGITDSQEAERNLTDISRDVLSILELSKIKDMATSEIADIISKKVLAGLAQSIEEAFEQLRAE